MTRSEPSNPLTVKPRPAASIAVFRDGKVLLAQRSKPPLQGVWSLPGGRVEPGEMVRDAALRELAEETGVMARIHGIADVVDVIVRDDEEKLRAHFVITSFYGEWTSGEATPASDCMGVDWVSLDELPDRNMTEGTADIIRRAAGLLAGRTVTDA